MSEIDEIKNLKDKLNSFQAESPGFDDIFGEEVLGEASLRHVFQSKLQSFKTHAPSFEELMNRNKPLVVPFSKRMIPFWSIAAAAVACLAFFFLMPEISKMGEEGISMVKEETSHKVIKRHVNRTVRPDNKFLTQRLTTPLKIKRIAISNVNDESSANSDSKRTSPADSINRVNLAKIPVSNYKSLSVDNGYSMEEIYAQARERKKNEKSEKMKAGLNFNGGNRLLAFVNTRQSGDFPLQATFDNYSEGLSSLDASTSNGISPLRSTTVSNNEWADLDNISSSSLANYKASYSLPLNVGLSVSIPFLKILEIQTGITYTYLSGVTSGTTGTSKFDLHQELHYLGIPVKLAVNIHEQGRFGMYASFGGALEKGLVGKQYSRVEGLDDCESSQKINGIQPIIGGQFGATYEIAPSFLLYVEPGANYYIPNDQPISSRTEERFNFNLGFGLRYRFK